MVRQRLYHTTEQKVAANRAKSKRSYDKCVNHPIIISITLNLRMVISIVSDKKT